MAQHDYVIANGTGAAVRSDLNNALAAIVSQNSGATEPATMYAYQWWADTTTGLLKLRNGANNAWITLRELDGTLTIEAGTVSAPGLAFASDLNTGVWSPGADQFAIATNGVERVEWGTSAVVFNDDGTNYDFRVEGDTNANLFFVDASTDRVGVGTNEPNSPFEVGIAGINLDGAIAALPDAGADSAAFIARTASTGSAPFNSAGSIIYRPRVSSTAGRSSHIFYTGSPSTIRMVIDETGKVGIGTTSPVQPLEVVTATGGGIALRPNAGNATQGLLWYDTGGGPYGFVKYDHQASALSFGTVNSERARIDSSGRVLVGTSTGRTVGNTAGSIQIENVTDTALTVTNNSNGSAGDSTFLTLARTRGTAVGGTTAVSNGDWLGNLDFAGHNGSSFNVAARISGQVDGAVSGGGAGDMPGRLVFSTTPDSGTTPVERMRISQSGLVSIPGVYSFTTAAAANVYVESAGQLSRATSSSKYKINVETIEDVYADALLSCRPVWYRSTCANDNPDWGWWGFIAEEVAAIDPRLVHWKRSEVTYDKNGSAVSTPCNPEPEGVMYDRFVPHLLNLIKRQQQAIETLEAKVAALESA